MRRATAAGFVLGALACMTACGAEGPSALDSATSELASTALPAACFDPPVHDCTFYASCMEVRHPCGATGYALGYGAKYCARFGGTDLSPAGEAWRDAVMVCLQRRLGRFLGEGPIACDTIRDGAFDDHPACYTAPGASICDLPPTDWIAIVSTIDADDLLSDRGRKQIGDTAARCLDTWARRIFSPFGDALDARPPAGTFEIADALARDPQARITSLKSLARATPTE